MSSDNNDAKWSSRILRAWRYNIDTIACSSTRDQRYVEKRLRMHPHNDTEIGQQGTLSKWALYLERSDDYRTLWKRATYHFIYIFTGNFKVTAVTTIAYLYIPKTPIIVKSKITSAVDFVNQIIKDLNHNINLNFNNRDSRIYVKTNRDQENLLSELAKNKIHHFTFARKNQKC